MIASDRTVRNICSKAWRVATLLSAVVLVLGATSVAAETYPNQPVRLIIPWPPGGAADILGRLVASKLSERLGQQVIVDNRPGASGNIGMELAAKALPDGHTFAIGSTPSLATNPSLYSKLPYHPFKDFAPISMGSWFAGILVVHPSVPAKSVSELVALAKASPGKLNYGSGGVGTPAHLAGELLKSMADLNIVHVPYKGAPPAVLDLLAGRVSLMFPPLPTVLSHVKTGKLRALGVTSVNRLPNLPDVPTIAESGLPGYEAIGWNGFVAPAKTPKDIISKLNTEIVRILDTPDVKQRLIDAGFVPMSSTPDEFTAFINAEFTKWEKVIKASGARAD